MSKKPNRDNEVYIYEVVSKNVKKYRKLRGLTQGELSEKIPYSYSTIISIEGNYRNNFSLAVISAIAKVLEIPPYLLFVDDDELDNLKDKYI